MMDSWPTFAVCTPLPACFLPSPLAGVSAAVLKWHGGRCRPDLHLGHQPFGCAAVGPALLLACSGPACLSSAAAPRSMAHTNEGKAQAYGTWVVRTPPLLGKRCRLQCRIVDPLPAVSRVQARFNAFIRTFKEHATDDGYKYMMLLEEVRQAGWPAQQPVSDAEREVLRTSSLGYTAGNKAGACMVEAAAGWQPLSAAGIAPLQAQWQIGPCCRHVLVAR